MLPTVDNLRNFLRTFGAKPSELQVLFRFSAELSLEYGSVFIRANLLFSALPHQQHVPCPATRLTTVNVKNLRTVSKLVSVAVYSV
jgi:hypothetical protein